MTTHDKKPDGVDTPLADQHDLESYRQAEEALSRLRAPILLHADNPHERLYIAALDGTGNSLTKNQSIVGKTYEQVSDLEDQGINNIRGGYVRGTYTQDNPIVRTYDGLTGFTAERRVETAYLQFCKQASEWLKEDSDAQIRLAGIGFSRGAEEVAMLHRLVEARGIQNPEDAKITRDKEGLVTHAEYTKPPLVPPGQTMQAALLYDPVSTGVKEHDRRLPSSMMSVVQITAEDERRDPFKSTNLVQPGFSEDNRFVNLTVGGAHGDIGDIYGLNGLGVRSGNLGVDFLNSLSDQPFLHKRAVPEDPALSVVHRSDQHLGGLYNSFGYRDGVRDHHNDVAPDVLCQRGAVRDCTLKEPINPVLDQQLERRGVPIGPMSATPEQAAVPGPALEVPAVQTQQPSAPKSEIDLLFDRLYQAALNEDDATMDAVGEDYLRSPMGQVWQQDVNKYGQQLEAQERQAALEAQQRQAALEAQQRQQAEQQAQETPTHKPHGMHR